MALLPRIRAQVTLATRKRVSGWPDGAHASVQTGGGFEFHDVREYVVGDDSADIDWKASARHGSLLVKRKVAHHRTTVLIAAATGRSMAAMAAPTVRKADLVLQVAATFASLAINHGDAVGMLGGDGSSSFAARPSTLTVPAERMLMKLKQSCQLHSQDANLVELLQLSSASLRKRGIVVVLCGDIEVDEQTERALKRLAARHQVMVVVVPDLDPTHPDLAGRRVMGVTDERLLPAELLRDAALAQEWRTRQEDQTRRRSAALARLSIPCLHLTAEAEVVPQVLTLVRGLRRAA